MLVLVCRAVGCASSDLSKIDRCVKTRLFIPYRYHFVCLIFMRRYICRMAEVYEKGTQGSVLAWRAASFLGDFSCYIKPHM